MVRRFGPSQSSQPASQPDNGKTAECSGMLHFHRNTSRCHLHHVRTYIITYCGPTGRRLPRSADRQTNFSGHTSLLSACWHVSLSRPTQLSSRHPTSYFAFRSFRKFSQNLFKDQFRTYLLPAYLFTLTDVDEILSFSGVVNEIPGLTTE